MEELLWLSWRIILHSAEAGCFFLAKWFLQIKRCHVLWPYKKRCLQSCCLARKGMAVAETSKQYWRPKAPREKVCGTPLDSSGCMLTWNKTQTVSEILIYIYKSLFIILIIKTMRANQGLHGWHICSVFCIISIPCPLTCHMLSTFPSCSYCSLLPRIELPPKLHHHFLHQPAMPLREEGSFTGDIWAHPKNLWDDTVPHHAKQCTFNHLFFLMAGWFYLAIGGLDPPTHPHWWTQ